MNDAAYTDRDLRDLGLTKLGQLNAGGLPESGFVMGCCAAIKRELLELCLPIPPTFGSHDVWLVNFAEGMGRRVIVPEVLQWYRRHDSNESQAVFNRTTKLTRWAVLKDTLGRHLTRGAELDATPDTTGLQFELLLTGANEAIQRADSPYKEELESMSRKVNETYLTYLERRSIRQRARALRVVPVLRLWAKGTYRNWRGFRSAVRDLLFR